MHENDRKIMIKVPLPSESMLSSTGETNKKAVNQKEHGICSNFSVEQNLGAKRQLRDRSKRNVVDDFWEEEEDDDNAGRRKRQRRI